MKKHLTDAAIERFRLPKQGSEEIFDAGYPGLALRIGHGGAKSFVIFHRVSGKLTRTTLGRWPSVSLREARDAWRRVAEGKPPTPEQESSTELFAKVVEDWLKLDIAPRAKASSLKVLSRIVDHDLKPALGTLHMDKITKRDIATLIDGIVARGAPIKARSAHAALHRCLKWSVGRGIIAANPMTGMEKPGKATSRDRVLSDAELVKVWKAAGDGMHGAVIRLLALTGARREEIAQLSWQEIRGDEIHLANGRTKNGEPRIIPLSKPALAVLASVPRISDVHVFSTDGRIGGWGHIKERLDKESGVRNWVIHDLRRTVATGMQRLGVGMQTVEAVLGHTSGSLAGVAGIYQRHDFASEKRAALEAWGKHVEAITK